MGELGSATEGLGRPMALASVTPTHTDTHTLYTSEQRNPLAERRVSRASASVLLVPPAVSLCACPPPCHDAHVLTHRWPVCPVHSLDPLRMPCL